MIEFHLDAGSGVAPYLQIVQQVRQAVRLGLLVEGEQLPTVKEVVGQLGEQSVDLVLETVLATVPAPVRPAAGHGAVPGAVIRVPGRWLWPRRLPC